MSWNFGLLMPASTGTCLAVVDRELAGQWNPIRNGAPSRQRPVAGCGGAAATGTSRRAWWLCPDSHVWKGAVASRTARQTGCPISAQRDWHRATDSLDVTHPDLAAQWHPDLNGDEVPAEVTYSSTRKPWWLCPEGHSWQALIHNRIRGSGCPYCAGKRATPTNNLAAKSPALAAQWHPTGNGTLTAADVTRTAAGEWPGYAHAGTRGAPTSTTGNALGDARAVIASPDLQTTLNIAAIARHRRTAATHPGVETCQYRERGCASAETSDRTRATA
jgi:hypothetical protein